MRFLLDVNVLVGLAFPSHSSHRKPIPGSAGSWPVDIDLRDLSDLQRSRLVGPNQIADMQLLLLAHRHRGQLVTLDTGTGELASGTRHANSPMVL